MRFRLKMKRGKKNLSYVDALGYIIAEKLGVKFLTGDNAFDGMDNVEYVK
jgi:predicted nucleic acid-binding protein